MKQLPYFSGIRKKIGTWVKRRRVVSKILSGNRLETKRELMLLLGQRAHIQNFELQALQKYAALATGKIVEIGAAHGASSLVFLMSKPAAVHSYSIDPFVKDSMADFQATEKECREAVARALHDIGMGERLRTWTLIADYSYNALKNFSGTIDILFIDGDHRYEAVKQDFEDWISLVKPGGHVLLHDSCRVSGTPDNAYNQGWPGPTQLAGELKGNPNVALIEQVESLSVFQKLTTQQ